MRIAIVGAGLSGSNVLRALITHPNFQTDDAIDVFEYREFLGAGLPYHPTDDESIMLNVAPDVMSVDLKNPDDFVEWLEENYEEPKNFENLVSRPKYGRYLLERFAPYFNHEQVRHIREAVIDLDVLEKDSVEKELTYRIKTTTGWVDGMYDAVFFTIGHPAYNDFYGLKDQENFFHNPYPMHEKLMDLNENSQIAIIGSGATGVDLMRFFFTNYELEKPLAFYDVKEPFHSVDIPYEKESLAYTLSKEWIEAQKNKHGGFLPLDVLIHTIQSDLAKENVNISSVYDRYKADSFDVYRKAMATKDQELAAIQKYASKTVGLLPHLYNALSGQDRDTYFERYFDKMQFFKSKVPYLSYEWLFDLMDAGKLIAKNGLQDVEALENGRFKITTSEEIVEADIVVNATGFNSNIHSLAKEQPLIANLYNKRIILSHINGNYILVDWPECRVINQQYGAMDNLFFLGLLIGGTQHENNDAGQTIGQANIVANVFMDKR